VLQKCRRIGLAARESMPHAKGRKLKRLHVTTAGAPGRASFNEDDFVAGSNAGEWQGCLFSCLQHGILQRSVEGPGNVSDFKSFN